MKYGGEESAIQSSLYSFIQHFVLDAVIKAFFIQGYGYETAVGLVLREGHLLW